MCRQQQDVTVVYAGAGIRSWCSTYVRRIFRLGVMMTRQFLISCGFDISVEFVEDEHT